MTPQRRDWRFRAAVAFGLLCAGTGPALSQQRQLLFLETFNAPTATESGSASAALWFSAKHLKLISGAGPDGSTALQVSYVPSAAGSERIAINLPLRRSVSRARLSFEVRFADGFPFGRGGKLLGLGPLSPVTGGDPRRPDGWSARMMWREGGRLSTYLYDQQSTRRFGIGDVSARPVLAPGEWHVVTMDLHLNNLGQADGAAEIEVDGRRVASSEGVLFAGRESGAVVPIDQLLFHTFFGGSDPSYQPRDSEGQPITVMALFDNLRVTSDERFGQPASSRARNPR